MNTDDMGEANWIDAADLPVPWISGNGAINSIECDYLDPTRPWHATATNAGGDVFHVHAPSRVQAERIGSRIAGTNYDAYMGQFSRKARTIVIKGDDHGGHFNSRGIFCDGVFLNGAYVGVYWEVSRRWSNQMRNTARASHLERKRRRAKGKR